MFKLLKNIWLGVLLIGLASLLLLLSDLGRRQGRSLVVKQQALPRLAVMQWSSSSLLDNTVKGIVEGLRQQGFENGRTATIRFFNAGGDAATGNMLAHELVSGGYDMVLTASTLALQAVATANREGRVMHLFGGVTDPYGAGVGITGPEPGQHPRHLLGVGTFQPVESAIRTAHQMNPALKRIGVVWNPGEDNSAACVKIARKICTELEVELIEVNANGTSEVPEAVRAVLGRGVDAVWVGGDVMASSAINAIVSASKAAGVPVFSNDPSDINNGVLFGLGASYEQVGFAVGDLGGKVLHGMDTATIGIKNMVPEVLALNEALADELPAWTLTEALRARAAASRAAVAVRRQPSPGHPYRVGILFFGPHRIFELAISGIKDGLQEAGFNEGGNLTIIPVHANSDMSMLPQVVRRLADQTPDVIIPLSTPCLAAALAGVKDIPLVFGVVSAPLTVGAGESFEKHLPNVTGAVWTAPNPAAFDWLQRLFPERRRVGVIYNASEANSRHEIESVRQLTAQRQMALEERSLSTSSEITETIQSLFGAGIDVVFGMADNTVVSSFTALAQACRRERIPLFADDNSLMGSGALFSIGASPVGEGRHAGEIAARVLLGERPADIPFAPGKSTEMAVDFDAAKQLGITLPADLLKNTDVFYNLCQREDRPLKIAMINLIQSNSLELGQKGVLRGLRESGLKEGVDFTVQYYNAQGEIAQLPAVLDAALNQRPDLIITVTTPALVAAANRVKEVPVVFTIASDPAALGIFSPETRPAHITGVHDNPALDKLLDMAIRHNPALKAVGIVFDPAQPNSVISVEKLRTACADRKIKLHEATAAALTELTTAVQSLIQKHAEALLLSTDNLVTAGFSAVHITAERAGIPIYVTDVNLMSEGATGAVGDDYEAWGAQSGRLAAKVLAGVAPVLLPVEPTLVQHVIEPAMAHVPVSALSRPYVIRMVRYNDAPFSTDTARGIMDGFTAAGWQEGREFSIRTLNAQGDMTTLSSILTAAVNDHPDLIMPISTPALQASLRQAGKLPIVFSSVGDGVQAGAGESISNHLPNVTGITTKSPFEDMAKLIRQTVPGIRNVGTLFSPAEINSELYRQWFEEALAHEGLKLIAVPVNSSADVAEATGILLRSDIQVIGQIADNTTRPGYGQIVKRANDAGLPFFVFDSAGMKDGAALALARDYYHTGIEAAEVAIRILQGESPERIPFANTRTEILAINPSVMDRFALRLPAEYQKQSTVYTE